MEKFIEEVAKQLPAFLLASALLLVGAAGGGILGMPVNSMDLIWRILLAIAAVALFGIGVWNLTHANSSGQSEDDEASGNRSNASYHIVKKTPRRNAVSLVSSLPMGETYNGYVDFTGTVEPIPDTGIWLVRQMVSRSLQEGTEKQVDYTFVYKADVSGDGVWKYRMYFQIWEQDRGSTFTVTPVVPSAETFLLFKHHWDVRARLNDLEAELTDRNSAVKRPYVDLPSEFARSFSSKNHREATTVILQRNSANRE